MEKQVAEKQKVSIILAFFSVVAISQISPLSTGTNVEVFLK
jgi:hypothetical protein